MPQAAILPIASLAMGGLGEVGNLFTGKQQAKAASNLSNAQANMENFLQGYAQNLANKPASQYVQEQQQFQQPLSANLINATTGAVYPQLAAMGLAGSPGQMQAGALTALAPYQLNEQQLAQQMEQWKTMAPLSAATPALEATQYLPQYFQQNQGAGTQLIAGLQGLSKVFGKGGGGGGGGGTVMDTPPFGGGGNQNTGFPIDLSTETMG